MNKELNDKATAALETFTETLNGIKKEFPENTKGDGYAILALGVEPKEPKGAIVRGALFGSVEDVSDMLLNIMMDQPKLARSITIAYKAFKKMRKDPIAELMSMLKNNEL